MKKTVVVVGTQWGDEGKGKITNFLGQSADVVVRYQGGDNAGHTIKFDGNVYALHTIPSGVFNPDTLNVLGNGVVFNPKTFLKEIEDLKKVGFSCENIVISDRAHVIFDYHQILDGINENNLGAKKIGTTKKGIGPAYTDKMARTGIRVGDFVSKDFKNLYLEQLSAKNKIIERVGEKTIDPESSLKEYLEIADKIRPYVKDTIPLLNGLLKNDKKILFEGAQGALLDIDFGTYPFVTSSNPSGGGVCIGSGIGPTYIGEIVGIVKAYSTRVGSGVFPTEIEGEIASYIRETGHEYGVTTRRPRRIGWLDGVVLKYSVMINGLTGLSVMLLDVLSDIEEIKLCTAYELDGNIIDTVPARIEDFEKCKPIYKTFKGWQGDITKITKYEDLPENARIYLEYIEEFIGVEVVIVSVGPDQLQTIVKKPTFWR